LSHSARVRALGVTAAVAAAILGISTSTVFSVRVLCAGDVKFDGGCGGALLYVLFGIATFVPVWLASALLAATIAPAAGSRVGVLLVFMAGAAAGLISWHVLPDIPTSIWWANGLGVCLVALAATASEIVFRRSTRKPTLTDQIPTAGALRDR
jgi:hypothetical protein